MKNQFVGNGPVRGKVVVQCLERVRIITELCQSVRSGIKPWFGIFGSPDAFLMRVGNHFRKTFVVLSFTLV